MGAFFLLILALVQPPNDVRIRLHGGTELEKRGKEQLERILATYELGKWLFTREIVIQSRVIPHSHPVLMLNTRYVENDRTQLATFLHEQLHWFVDGVPDESVEAATAELRDMYPNVPAKPPEGARNEESTYLHLIVCSLELQALIQVVGESAAREELRGFSHYTWVYETILKDSARLAELLARHGLVVP